MLTQLAPRLGCPNIVVSLTTAGSLGPELRSAGVPVLALGMKRGRPSLAAIFRLRNIIKRERPTLLQTWLYHADLLGLVTSFFLHDVPVVWNLRCSDLDLSKYSFDTRAVRWLSARVSSLPAAIVVNSEAGRLSHEAIGYRAKRWELIPNGFDTELFQPDAAARAR
ncbi:MAG: glycosyltransferase, partial [Stellaceae bacterium]